MSISDCSSDVCSSDLRFRGGSAFERAIWQAMLEIPWGETRSYGDLAALSGGVARAVGGACGRNPIPIVVPCHRVVGAGGRLVGFSGAEGVATKQWLLDFERGQDRKSTRLNSSH